MLQRSSKQSTAKRETHDHCTTEGKPALSWQYGSVHFTGGVWLPSPGGMGQLVKCSNFLEELIIMMRGWLFVGQRVSEECLGTGDFTRVQLCSMPASLIGGFPFYREVTPRKTHTLMTQEKLT